MKRLVNLDVKGATVFIDPESITSLQMSGKSLKVTLSSGEFFMVDGVTPKSLVEYLNSERGLPIKAV